MKIYKKFVFFIFGFILLSSMTELVPKEFLACGGCGDKGKKHRYNEVFVETFAGTSCFYS
jgi:hypothetical protein